MREISLSQGKKVMVDDEDYDFLMQWKWYCNKAGYAVRENYTGMKDGKRIRRTIRMHRLINKTPEELETDHIDGNTLNNRKENLRNVAHSKNMFNLKVADNNSSGHSGISWHKETKKWRAYINLKGKQIYLGLYNNIEDAISNRLKAKQKYHEGF
jgi:hypothetical protein